MLPIKKRIHGNLKPRRMNDLVQSGLEQSNNWFRLNFIARIFIRRKYFYYRTAYQGEKMKYGLTNERKGNTIGHSMLAGILLGTIVHAVANKQKYDDRQIRDKGSVDYHDLDLNNAAARFLKLQVIIWFERYFIMDRGPIKPQLEVSLEEFTILEYKRLILNSDRLIYYNKNRDYSFDFVNLAEREDIYD